MQAPAIKDEFPMHIHTCSGCTQTMRHWNINICKLPDTILCETCKNLPVEKES